MATQSNHIHRVQSLQCSENMWDRIFVVHHCTSVSGVPLLRYFRLEDHVVLPEDWCMDATVEVYDICFA